MLLEAVVVCLLCYVGFLWYRIKTKVTCESKADLSGKTAIITGANTGIGFCTALDLAKRNAKVILACRNRNQGVKAQNEIQRCTGNSDVIFKHLDVANLTSVRKFATEIKAEENKLHILINNAGVSSVPFKRTDEGLETNMATNHFGPFLLTNLLLDLMKKSAPARIINVSSVVHGWTSNLDLENLNSEKYFNKATIYFQTKLANVLFTRELSKLLEGTGVTANSLHPGTVNTHLLRHLNPMLRFVIANVIGGLFFKSPEEGAQTSIYCAVSEKLCDVTGKYFVDCCIANEARVAKDDAVARKLWELSEKYTGIT